MPDPYPQPLSELIEALARLPGIGKRTAERLALALLDWDTEQVRDFGQRIASLPTDIKTCKICGNLAAEDTCRICANPRRDHTTLCVVEQASQIPVIESSGCYRGVYHVLGGRLVPLEGKGPDSLRLKELEARVAEGDISEVILATSADVEGQATASYIRETLANTGVSVTRIAFGIPVGADLSYADPATIAMAINTRRSE